MFEWFLESSVLLLMELFLDFDIPIILKTMIHEKKNKWGGSEFLQLCNDFK